MTAIVTEGEMRQSLSAVRALGRARIAVAVGAKKKPSLSMWSRYARSGFLMEDAGVNPRLFVEHLAEELRARYAVCALISSDSALWALSRYREFLPETARRILPPHYSVVRVLDHEALHYFAESLGIACAPFVRIPAHADEKELFSLVKDLKFPLLARPIIPWSEREDGGGHADHPVVINKETELRGLLEGSEVKNGFLLSAYSAVRAISYFGVAEKGSVLVEGFQERLNEHVPHNEIATLTQTITPIVAIRHHSQKLLEALQWQGPFKVEFIKDKRGNYRLISVIGRLWGSLELAVKAEVNIPLICYRLAENTVSKDIIKNAQPNIRLRWLMGDMAAKISHPFQFLSSVGRQAVSFPSSLRSLFSKKDRVSTFYDVADLDDPMPFLFELQYKTYKRVFFEKR